MSVLSRQRCSIHAQREAVALCPGCRRYFCRECVTEHDDRVLCAACLAKQAKPPQARRLWLGGAARLAFLLLSFMALWLFFNYCGHLLLTIPSQYHDNTFLTDQNPER